MAPRIRRGKFHQACQGATGADGGEKVCPTLALGFNRLAERLKALYGSLVGAASGRI